MYDENTHLENEALKSEQLENEQLENEQSDAGDQGSPDTMAADPDVAGSSEPCEVSEEPQSEAAHLLVENASGEVEYELEMQEEMQEATIKESDPVAEDALECLKFEHTLAGLKPIIEAILFSANKPMSAKAIQGTVSQVNVPEITLVKEALASLVDDYKERGVRLVEVSSGYRFQVPESVMPWVQQLQPEKPQRYSRALLETLALIAYRQPITRGEIEDIRGVAVSSYIIRTLQERKWIRVVGHKEVPGRPALLATTGDFLDYFNLKSLQDLPVLTEVRDLDGNEVDLDEMGTLSGVEALDTIGGSGGSGSGGSGSGGSSGSDASGSDSMSESELQQLIDEGEEAEALLDPIALVDPIEVTAGAEVDQLVGSDQGSAPVSFEALNARYDQAEDASTEEAGSLEGQE